jgi:glycosyltransferase involved in cell wall biosynthesis
MSDPIPVVASGPAPEARRPSLLIVATTYRTIMSFLLPHAQHYRSSGWRVDAAGGPLRISADATAYPDFVSRFDHAYLLPLTRSILDIRGILKAGRELNAIIDQWRPDIVHVHTPIASFVARTVVRLRPRSSRPAIVYTAHGFHFFPGGNPLANAVFLLVERVAGRWTDRLVVINEEDEAAAIRHRIVPRRRLCRIPGGVGLDLAYWSADAVAGQDVADVRSRLGIEPGEPMFVIIGELNRNKSQGDAIAAMAAVRGARPHLVLLGDGPTRGELTAQARELGLEDRVHFLGFIAEVRPFVRAANALLLVSRREGLARSVMEGLALGRPVIASTARGNRELLAGGGGILVEVGDVAALTSAMERLIDDPAEAEAMGLRGRQSMVDGCDQEDIIRLHDAIYADVLAEREASAR